jgi:hypothetical protein
MEWFLVFGLGLFFGWLLTWFWISTTTRWKKSKDLRTGSAKTLKEQSEKAKKARQDASVARREAVGAIFRVVFFVIAMMFGLYLLWAFFA